MEFSWGWFFLFALFSRESSASEKWETVIAFLHRSEIAVSCHSPCLFSIHKFTPFQVELGGIRHACSKDDKYYIAKYYLKQDEKFPTEHNLVM